MQTHIIENHLPFPDELRHIEIVYNTSEISRIIGWIESSFYADTLITDTNIPTKSGGSIFYEAIADILHRWLAERIENLEWAIEFTKQRLVLLRNQKRGAYNTHPANKADSDTVEEVSGVYLMNILHVMVLINEAKIAESET